MENKKANLKWNGDLTDLKTYIMRSLNESSLNESSLRAWEVYDMFKPGTLIEVHLNGGYEGKNSKGDIASIYEIIVLLDIDPINGRLRGFQPNENWSCDIEKTFDNITLGWDRGGHIGRAVKVWLDTPLRRESRSREIFDYMRRHKPDWETSKSDEECAYLDGYKGGIVRK